jgi:hypothetical protein
LMRFPARNCLQLLLAPHVLEEGNDPPQFWRDGGLETGGVILLDEPAQALVDPRF